MVTSQPDAVDVTATFLSSHRRLELKSDPKKTILILVHSALCTHFVSFPTLAETDKQRKREVKRKTEKTKEGPKVYSTAQDGSKNRFFTEEFSLEIVMNLRPKKIRCRTS